MNFTERVRYVLESEANAIRSIDPALIDGALVLLADCIINCKGKIIVSGVGKNASIAERVAATLACSGTPSFFMSCSNAVHGDLGMVSPGDVVIALSNSGRTQEIIDVVGYIREYKENVKIAVITGNSNSPLFDLADISLCYGEVIEPCPLGLTPSSSLAVMSAILDGLALGIMERRGFSLEDYGRNHKKGYISVKIAEERKVRYKDSNE